MIPKSALNEMQNELNKYASYKVVIVCNYKGHTWERVLERNVCVGDTLTIEFDGFDVKDCEMVRTKKKWWEFWKC